MEQQTEESIIILKDLFEYLNGRGVKCNFYIPNHSNLVSIDITNGQAVSLPSIVFRTFEYIGHVVLVGKNLSCDCERIKPIRISPPESTKISIADPQYREKVYEWLSKFGN